MAQKFQIVAERELGKRLSDDLVWQQLQKCAAISLKGTRGQGWSFQPGSCEQINTTNGVKYRAFLKFSPTVNRASVKDKWPRIVKRFAEAGCAGSWRKNAWIVVSPDGFKDIAAEAQQEHVKSETKKKMAEEPKTLGEINLEPGDNFKRIFGREAQVRRIIDALRLGKKTDWRKRYNTLLDGPPGCHVRGTQVLRSDGHPINVEEVKVGDRLLSYDGYRTVLNLVHGTGRLYRIVPKKGDAFIVNEDHILTLSRSRGKRRGELLDVSVREWLNWSNNRKTNYKLIRSEEVEFEREPVHLVIPPYCMGMMLGDGCVIRFPRVTCHELDFPHVPEITYLAEQFELDVNVYPKCTGEKGDSFDITLTGTRKHRNPLMEAFSQFGLEGCGSHDKFVPECYKYAPARDRLELLAGLIDTDGEQHRGVMSFTSASKQLAVDLMFVARSLGFAAYLSEEVVFIDEMPHIYHRVNLSGNLSRIPCRHERKRAAIRRQRKSVLRTGFVVEPVGEGEYFGFVLDGDHRYLMSDFTITHNCGKSEIMLALAQMLGAENEAWRWFDATSMTKAGAVEEIIESKVVPPVLFIEEIEKCEETALRWLLGVMDTRGQIRRTNYRVGNQARNVRMVVIASANNVKLLKQVMSGALYSRFQNKIYCPEPDREIMRRILLREIKEIDGSPKWVEPTLSFAYDKWGIKDPRDVVNIMACGGERLLTGDAQADYEATMHPLEKRDLLRRKDGKRRKRDTSLELRKRGDSFNAVGEDTR